MNYKLPPLPETGYMMGGKGYSGSQMQAYAIAAIEAQASVVQQEPVAWMWKNTKTDAEGVYLEDPATIGIELNHPAYQWTLLYTHPAQQALTPCNCRWDGETQVQQCTLHKAHVEAIHEWAERAKTAEKTLSAQQAKPQPLSDEQETILNFLLGASDMDGVWFGDKHPQHHGQFWWRDHLRKAFQQPAHGITKE